MDNKDINQENIKSTTHTENSKCNCSNCTCTEQNNNCHCCHNTTEPNKPSVEDLNKQLSDITDKYLRAMAEMENIKKRARADIESGSKSQMIKLATSFFPAIDAIISAKNSLSNENDKKGLELVLQSIENALKNVEIEFIKSTGEVFNPKYHQAISMIEDKKYEKNTIISEMMVGFKLGDTVLRPSMVIVAK